MKKRSLSHSRRVLALTVMLMVGGLLWWTGSRPRSGEIPAAAQLAVFTPSGASHQAVNELAATFPAAAYPEIATAPVIRESLALLAKNGADLARPMPSRHRILAATRGIATQVTEWGRAHGFSASAVESYFEHGGVEQFAVELIRTEVPEPASIEAQGRQVFGAIQQIPGAYYQTWQGAVVR
jgi:hypothetical protein